MTSEYLEYLKNYSGKKLRLMEVCGSHTAAVARSGVRDIISKRIELISGPGCPVCVCPSGYVDRLCSLAENGSIIVTFGDMLRIPGSRYSLYELKGQGVDIRMVYSPLDVVSFALDEKEKNFVFAAVGFETTIPVYTLLLDEIIGSKIHNIRLLTALKCMGPVIGFLCEREADIDGFIAPGHVSVITGAGYFRSISKQYGIPFAVTGFEDAELIRGIYGLVRLCEKKENEGRDADLTANFYTSVVTENGNEKALEKIKYYFESGDTIWRGLGNIPGSGLYLKKEFCQFDAGSFGLNEDVKINPLCCCDRVLAGKMTPAQCPLFKSRCTPVSPQGACMVSSEGSCYQYSLI